MPPKKDPDADNSRLSRRDGGGRGDRDRKKKERDRDRSSSSERRSRADSSSSERSRSRSQSESRFTDDARDARDKTQRMASKYQVTGGKVASAGRADKNAATGIWRRDGSPRATRIKAFSGSGGGLTKGIKGEGRDTKPKHPGTYKASYYAEVAPGTFTTTGGGVPRHQDTEVKILEEVLTQTNKADKGIVTIYTERRPCKSCRGVINQFKGERPGIKVDVYHGERRKSGTYKLDLSKLGLRRSSRSRSRSEERRERRK